MNKGKYYITAGILVLVVVGFLGGPLTGVLQGQYRNAISFGKYGSTAIVYQAGNYFDEQLNEISLAYQSRNQNIDSFTSQTIWREAFDASVEQAAILREVSEARLDISQKEVDRAIARAPRFQDVNGDFDIEYYRSTTQQDRQRFRSYLYEELKREEYLTDMRDRVLVSSAELEFVAAIDDEERQIGYVAIAVDDVPIDEYITDSPDEFVRLQVQTLALELGSELAAQVRGEIRDDGSNFEEIRVQYTTDENSVADADVADVIGDGALEDALGIPQQDSGAAAEGDAGGGGGLNLPRREWFFYNDLRTQYTGVDGLEDLLRLPVGEVSGVYSIGDERSVIFYLTGRETYDQIDDELLGEYARRRLAGDRDSFLELGAGVAEQLIADAGEREGGLARAAGANDFEYYTSEFFPLNIGNSELFAEVSGGEDFGFLEGLENNTDAMADIFSLEVGELAEPIIIGNYYLVAELQGVETIIDAAEDGESGVDAGFERFYRSRAGDYLEQDISRTLIRRDLLVDNFTSAYSEFVETTTP